MAEKPNVTRAQIKRLIEAEVRQAFRTQMADSTDCVHPVVDQFGVGATLAIGDFTLNAVLIPADNQDKAAIAALQALGKPKPSKKKAAPKSPR